MTFSPVHNEPLDEDSMQEYVFQGPMFVDLANAEDERYLRRSYSERGSDADEEDEVRSLIRGRVGGWVDYFVGWMDFRGDELGDAIDEEEEGIHKEVDGHRGDYRSKKWEGPKGKMKASHDEEDKTKDGVQELEVENGKTTVTSSEEDGGAWSDAKWLLSAVSKALF